MDELVAVLGLGEAGSRYAADLLTQGVPVVGYDPVPDRGPAGIRRADSPGEAVSQATIVLSLNSAEHASEVAAQAVAGMSPGAIFADFNSASPETKRRVGQVVAGAGGRFVDVAVLAPVTRDGLRTPLVVSGPGRAPLASFLARFDVPVGDAGSEPGAAAARKLFRSAFMKGLAAVVIESLELAASVGEQEWLRGQIVSELSGDPVALVDRLVQGTPRHARRRLEEMRAVAELAADTGASTFVIEATIARLEDLVARDEAGETS